MFTATILRRIAVVALALALIAQIIPAHAARLGNSDRAGEVLVRLLPGADAHALAARANLKLLDQLPDQALYRFAIADGVSAREKAAALASQPGVAAAEPNAAVVSPWAQRRVTWVVGSDAADYAAQWAPERMNLAAAHSITRGAGVTVAILDTGVDPDHPALKEHLDGGYDFVDDDSDPREQGSADVDGGFGHGTHVAGLVALVAPEARILPLRTLAPDGSGDLWTQIVALNYAAERGAQVINMSFSFGERSRIFDDFLGSVTCTANGGQTCSRGRLAGAVAVAAAGNTGAAVREFPGASTIPGAIGVAASNQGDALSAFSTFGPWLAVAAPGEAIVSTVPGGGYAAWSGTSMAAPLVAGTAALVRSAAPLLSSAEVVRRIVDSADPIDARVRRRVDAGNAVGSQ
jgi:subtilisin family serine protease